jgi:hypothetical protein
MRLQKEKARYTPSICEKLVEEATLAFEWTKRTFDDTETEDPYCEVPGLKKSRDGIFQNNSVSIPRRASPQH